MAEASDIEVVKAPWTLTGRGVVALYTADRAVGLAHGHIPEPLRDSYRGGLGFLMLVDYDASPVGPYHEILFCPGAFDVGGRRHFSITRIYVSSMPSVVSGRANWGIPKRYADFHVEREGKRETWQVDADGVRIFDCEVDARAVKIPVNTAWLPLPPHLAQLGDGHIKRVTPSGKGSCRLGAMRTARGHADGFVDVARFKRRGTFVIPRFELTFPEAAVSPLPSGEGET